MKRIRLAVLFSIIAVVMLCLAFISTASGDRPILYRNDTKYTISDYPAETVDGKLYVPVSFFVGLNNIQYKFSSDPAGFYLRNTVTERYLSFSSNVDSIVVDGTLIDVKFPIMNSTVYMPLDYCAEILSLKVEKRNDGKIKRVRVSDGTQKLDFSELIKLYETTEKPDDPSVIEPERPGDPVVTVPQTDRSIYVTVNGCDEYTDAVLDVLKSKNTKMTFFFDQEGIQAYPEAVIRCFVAGHSIGVLGDTPEKVHTANEALSSVLNFKTRLCRITGDITEEEIKKMISLGYILWDSNVEVEANDSRTPKNIARYVYNKTFENDVTTVSIGSSDKIAKTVEQIIYYIDGDEYITHKPIELTEETERGGN